MTCTKTGGYVFIEEYGEYAYGDCYEVGNVAVFNIAERAYKPCGPVVHYTIHKLAHQVKANADCVDWVLVATRFTNHGYDGIAPP